MNPTLDLERQLETPAVASSRAESPASEGTAVRRLANQYADRHQRLDKLIFMYAVLGFMGDIVKAEKRRLLEPLQDRLNRLVPSVPSMADEEYAAFERLRSLHATIAGSRDTFLGAGSLTRIAGAALLSTITVVATALIQEYVQRLT